MKPGVVEPPGASTPKVARSVSAMEPVWPVGWPPLRAAAANSYCRTHEFGQALSYRKVDRDDITGAIPASAPGSCHGAHCDDFVAIECSR